MYWGPFKIQPWCPEKCNHESVWGHGWDGKFFEQASSHRPIVPWQRWSRGMGCTLNIFEWCQDLLDQATAPCANLLKKSSTKSLMVSAANCLAAKLWRTAGPGHTCETKANIFFLTAKFRFDAPRGFPKATPVFSQVGTSPHVGAGILVKLKETPKPRHDRQAWQKLRSIIFFWYCGLTCNILKKLKIIQIQAGLCVP